MIPAVDKQALRRAARAVRAGLHAAAPYAGDAIAAHFLAGIAIPGSAVVAGYLPAHDETDPRPLMEALRRLGHVVALPRIAAKNAPLDFHVWKDGAPPVPGAFGLLEADPAWPRITPDVVLVPLLAFDAMGFRLGYGGGFYDRTLAHLRVHDTVLTAGIAFAGQEVEHLPHEATDERLDWIVTECGARRFPENGAVAHHPHGG